MDTAQAEAAVAAWRDVDARITLTECDGVPVLWSPMPGHLQAHLMFRVGRADEPFARGGITHMVEHLTLSALGDVPYRMNGAVGGDVTHFVVEGEDDEVVAHLDHVCRTLHALPLERFETERTVLRTEAARRNGELVPSLLWLRYGPTGWGLLDVDEHGLRAATADEVQEWARRHFVAANAVLVLSGPPPPGLHLDLPGGEHLPLAPPRPVQQPLPSFVQRRSRVAGTGVLLPRDPGARAFLRHGHRRLTQRLRVDLGVTYDVSGSWQRVSPDRQHASFAADSLPDRATEVCSAMLDELDRLAEAGVDAEELARDVEQLRRAGARPDAAFGTAMLRAVGSLHRDPWCTSAEAAEDVVALQPADIAAMAAQARDSSLWIVPNEATLPAWHFQDYVGWSPAGVAGRSFAPVEPPTADTQPASLVVGDRGASLVLSRQRFVTVPWDDCVGMLAWSTGERMLFSSEGFRLLFDPSKWHQAEEIAGELDRRVPPGAVVPMGPMEKEAPASTTPATAAAAAPRRRWRRLGFPNLQLRLAFPCALLAAALWSAAIPTSHTTPDPGPGPAPHFTVDSSGQLVVVPQPGPSPQDGSRDASQDDTGMVIAAAAATGGAAGLGGVGFLRLARSRRQRRQGLAG